MSKSLGNGIDPLDVVKLYGADALRWTLIAGMGMGADVILDPNDIDKSFATGRNFGTKLWNIGRFLLDRVGDSAGEVGRRGGPRIAHAGRSMDSRSARRRDRTNAIVRLARSGRRCRTIRRMHARGARTSAIAGLRLNEYAESARRFVWNELADWYLESVKADSMRRGRTAKWRGRSSCTRSTARCACCTPSCRS